MQNRPKMAIFGANLTINYITGSITSQTPSSGVVIDTVKAI